MGRGMVAFVRGTPSAALLAAQLLGVLLTGTGTSDILPITGHARSVVMVEQAVGLFYVATVVTTLVGLQAMRKRVRPCP